MVDVARLVSLLLVMASWWAHRAVAQDLTPRAYVISPVASNAVILGYSHQAGSLQFDGAVPISGAQADINLPFLSYYHSLGVFGRAANFSISVPYGIGDFSGTVADVPKFAHRSGFLDSSWRFSVNLLGGPAMGPAEFVKWRQKVLLGASLKIVAPTGAYDATRVVNWGNNRWAFKPEIGYSERFGHWVLDAYGGAWLFTKNPNYFPGDKSQAETTVGAFEGHISYDFHARAWISLDANYWWGGTTSLNGVQNPRTNQKNSRVGVTASIPLTAHQAVKLSYSDGAFVQYGGNYRTIALAWQYSWVGWPPLGH